MKRLEKNALLWAKTGAALVVTSSGSLLGAFLLLYGVYRLSHSVLESPLFYILSGGLLVLTFNQHVRLQVIRLLPVEVRKYLYEKSLVDVTLDISAAGQGIMGLITASGLLRRDEIRLVTDSLPEEYQFVTQRGLIHLLPEPFQGALNPLYNVGEALFSDYERDMESRAERRRRIARPLTITDMPALPPRPDEIDDDATESMLYPSASSGYVRGVQVVSDAGLGIEEETANGEIFVLPGAVVDTGQTTSTVSDGSNNNNNNNYLSSQGQVPSIEEVIVDILSQRAKDALEYSRQVALDAAAYITTGGDASDSTLLSSALTLGIAGNLLSSYDVATPIARTAAGALQGDSDRSMSLIASETAGRVVLRGLLSPVNTTLRTLGPVLYLLSVASGGMYVNRLLSRHDVYGLCNRAALTPLYNMVQLCHSRSLTLYQRLSNGNQVRAQLAAVVTTLTVVVAWHMRQHWRRWRWLLTIIVARIHAKIAAQAAAVSSYFR